MTSHELSLHAFVAPHIMIIGSLQHIMAEMRNEQEAFRFENR